MKKSNTPIQEQIENNEPVDDEVVLADSSEGYKICVYLVESQTVEQTSARTYGSNFGHYFVEERSEATQTLDEILSFVEPFERTEGQSYEITVEASNKVSESNYCYRRTNMLEANFPSDVKYCEMVDELLQNIEDDIVR